MSALSEAALLPLRVVRRARRELSQTRPAQQRRVDDYLARHIVRKLHLGAGAGPLGGWLNTDINVYHPDVTFMDATKPFPIPDGSFDYVYGEHLIEHLPLHHAFSMLKECARILRPGGRIRFATPPLETLVELYSGRQEARTETHRRCLEWALGTWLPDEWKVVPGVTAECAMLNCQFRNWGHQFLYDRATLEGVARHAGFANIHWHAMQESDDPALRRVEQHGRIFGDEAMIAFTTMCVEATKARALEGSAATQ